jgi:hypothetical protein
MNGKPMKAKNTESSVALEETTFFAGNNKRRLLASEWVNLNGKAALEALFTG